MKKVVLCVFMLFVSLSASAQWVVGGAYTNLSDDVGNSDFSLGALVGSIGYRFYPEGDTGFSIMPELRIGFGVGDDTVLGVEFELDRYAAINLRGQYAFDSGFYGFIAPSYTNIEVTGSFGGITVTEDDTEFGLGGGIGYMFNKQVHAEVLFEGIDGTDVFTFALKAQF